MCGTINGCISTGATEANLKTGSNLFGSRFTASRCCTRREKWLFSWRHCPPLTVAIAARVRSSSDSVSVWPHNWPAAVEEFAKVSRLVASEGRHRAPPACAEYADVDSCGPGRKGQVKGQARSAVFCGASRCNGPAWLRFPPPKASGVDVKVRWRDQPVLCGKAVSWRDKEDVAAGTCMLSDARDGSCMHVGSCAESWLVAIGVTIGVPAAIAAPAKGVLCVCGVTETER